MCIICKNFYVGSQYLISISSAIRSLKKAEKLILQLSKEYPDSNYDSAHKKLVKTRKQIGKVEVMRELERKQNKV